MSGILINYFFCEISQKQTRRIRETKKFPWHSLSKDTRSENHFASRKIRTAYYNLYGKTDIGQGVTKEGPTYRIIIIY
jgi:hypothetical protein